MKNIYFPEETIGFNEIFFVCYMIERTARHIKQRNRYVVEHLGDEGLKRQLSIANTIHSMNPEQVVADWIEEYGLEQGDTDVTKVDHRFTDKVPTDIQMGKVYARLVQSVTSDNESLSATIRSVYASPICDVIDNYNSSAYYEPSYVQTRAYYAGAFI